MTHFIRTYIKWIMLVGGVLTLSMIQAVISPNSALSGMFGSTLDGPAAEIVVRNWGFLIALVGAVLIYGAFVPAVRSFALCIAGSSKIAFVSLALIYGRNIMTGQLATSIAFDTALIAIFIIYLITARDGATP